MQETSILRQHGEVTKLPLAQSQALVDLDRARVILSDMKKRCLPPIADAFHHFHHQNSSVALASVLRMGADGADLCMAGNLQTLARHGHQLSFQAYPQVGA